MAAVAAAVGYESEASFGKAFRRVMGVSPGRYRRGDGAGAMRKAGAGT
ncbi:MAG: Helix-turn-helix domain [Phycisphaerales bacterium]|nr:Helix-turn-helix domain [Phycisphaerales bacterium]